MCKPESSPCGTHEPVAPQGIRSDWEIKLVVVICSQSCHNVKKSSSKVALPAGFRAALPNLFRRLQAGSINSRWLTSHAVDGGYVPRFLAFVWL